jgi:hypothetical protein
MARALTIVCRRVARTQAGRQCPLAFEAIVLLCVNHVYQQLVCITAVWDTLGTNGFFDGGSRKAAWCSSTLLPLLQCSFRDLQFQRRLALR